MDSLDQHFQHFLRERVYLHNVAPKTSEWSRDVWHVFQRWLATLPSHEQSRGVISRSDLQEFVVHLGHTEVGTTMKYLHLLTEDLQRPHQGLSILNRLSMNVVRR